MGIGVGISVLLIGLAVMIAGRPRTFRVARSATLSAPADVVFSYVNDFRQWAQWSPFEQPGPTMRKTYEGSPAGAGAVYGWSGGGNVGAGRMTIRESVPERRIAIAMQSVKPFRAENQVEFLFEPLDEGVRVTWAMSGKNTFVAKACSLVLDLDSLRGKDFEQGLAMLGAVTQADNKRRSSLPPQPISPQPATPASHS